MHAIVIRHGQTAWNCRRIVIGQADPPLNDLGYHQARVLARCLKQFSFSAVWTSDLRRAVQTAEIVNLCHRAKLIRSQLLREANFGILEGKSMEDPSISDEWLAREPNKYGYRPSAGESYFEMEPRVLSFLNSSLDRSDNGLSLIVTHVGTIRVLYRLCNSASPNDAGALSPRHADIWNLEWGTEKRALRLFASVDTGENQCSWSDEGIEGVFYHLDSKPPESEGFEYQVLRFYPNGVVLHTLGLFSTDITTIWSTISKWFNRENKQPGFYSGHYVLDGNQLYSSVRLAPEIGLKHDTVEFDGSYVGDQLVLNLRQPTGIMDRDVPFQKLKL